MRVFNEQIASGVVLNANRIIPSGSQPFVPLKFIFMYSIMVAITGTPTGTLKLQGSNDPETNGTQPSTWVPTHWADIDNSSVSVSAAGNTMYNVTDVAYNYVRVVYTDGSGGASTAVATVVFNGKGQ